MEGFIDDALGPVRSAVHRRGLKVWFGASAQRANREHYEAQLIRLDGEPALEIGFHAEHASQADNLAAMARLGAHRGTWTAALGDEAEEGPFLGREGWQRISEVWPPPDPDDPDSTIEVAARLADYIDAIEPVRRATLNP